MTPQEHLALARAEYDAADRQVQQQMYSTPEQRLLAAQTECLLALTEHFVRPRKRLRKLLRR